MPSISKPKSIAGAIMANRKPAGGLDIEIEEEMPMDDMEMDMDAGGGEDEGLLAAARDLIDAVQANDEAGVVGAMRAAFDLMEMQPHEEFEPEIEEEMEYEDEI